MKTSLLIAALAAAPLLVGCIDKATIATVPDAENQLFTPDGRLIVTGGTGVWEIVPSGTGFMAQAIAADVPAGCNFTGLAHTRGWVFTTCVGSTPTGAADNHLLAAAVPADRGAPMHFVQVPRPSPDPLDALKLPNGMAVAPNGKLLIADFGSLMPAAVARATLDFSAGTPRVTTFEPAWLGGEHDITHPNGLRVRNNELFVSELATVKRYQFDSAGEIPRTLPTPWGGSVANEVLVYQGLTVVDDIQPQCGGLIVNDFLGGKLIYLAPAGTDFNGLPTYRLALQSGAFSLQQPSSAQVGRGPMFSGDDLLVTEKGVIGEFSSDYGNKLSRVKATVDLNDPAVCARINAS